MEGHRAGVGEEGIARYGQRLDRVEVDWVEYVGRECRMGVLELQILDVHVWICNLASTPSLKPATA